MARNVVFAPEAQTDLIELYDFIASRSSVGQHRIPRHRRDGNNLPRRASLTRLRTHEHRQAPPLIRDIDPLRVTAEEWRNSYE